MTSLDLSNRERYRILTAYIAIIMDELLLRNQQ